MPGSGELFGTRRPVKVAGTIDDIPFEATLLPMGDGDHMVPIKAALRTKLGKATATRWPCTCDSGSADDTNG